LLDEARGQFFLPDGRRPMGYILRAAPRARGEDTYLAGRGAVDLAGFVFKLIGDVGARSITNLYPFGVPSIVLLLL